MNIAEILKCNLCGEFKYTRDFHRSKKAPSGHQYHCKSCSTKQARLGRKIGGDGVKKCSYCGLLKEVYEFKLKRNRPDGLMEWCRSCGDMVAETKGHNGARSAHAILEKAKDIQGLDRVCPGCQIDFSQCPDEALKMIFEKSHVHSRMCRRMNVVSRKLYFWSCRVCNAKQADQCGAYTGLGVFVKLDCSKEVADVQTK